MKVPKISCLLAILLFSASVGFSQKKNMAIGLRVGEPLAVSFKKYFNGGDNALEINVGSYGYTGGYGSGKYGAYNGNYRKYNNYYYKNGGLMIMVDYLWHKDLEKTAGLTWYWGVGGQLRSLNYLRYDNNLYEEYRGIGIGPKGSIGLEWTPVTLPELSVFADVGLYLEIVPQPWANLQGGLGCRFNF